MEDEHGSSLLARSTSHSPDEMRVFRSWLKWLCVDQSNPWTTSISWLVFLSLSILVPTLSHFVSSPPDNDSRPYAAVAQLSLTSVSALSFLSLSIFARRYGLRKFLFLDNLRHETEPVRNAYTHHFNRSTKLLFVFVIPCFAFESGYVTWRYGARVPFLGFLELCSWLYRTVVFFLVCVLFRLICCLQILRLDDFARFFAGEGLDVESILREHLRIKRHLRIISHRFRVFILWALVFITASQFASLLFTTREPARVSVFHTGELAVCSVSLVAGLSIILRSATKITHKAQAVRCLAAKWHVCATIELFDAGGASDLDDVGDEEDELDNTKFVPSYAHSTISFQRRQALVTYFENNGAGITIYGFMLDRGSLRTIFGIELSLVLWLLGKTVGIS